MAEEKRNWLGPYLAQENWLKELVQQAKLAWGLLGDKRVPLITKLIPVAAIAYLISPIDIVPDSLPLLTQLDDAAILMLGLRLFFEFSPPEVVSEHLRRIVYRMHGNWQVSEHPPQTNDDIIDATVEDKGGPPAVGNGPFSGV